MGYQVPVLTLFEWQPPVIDKDLTAPPVSPAPEKGDRYLIYGTGTGAWSGQTGNIAVYSGSEWEFIAKRSGMLTFVEDEGRFYLYQAAWGLFPVEVLEKGGTIYNADGIPNAALNIAVWRAPFACTVKRIYGLRTGGTGATVNARKNGTSNHLGTALSLTSADTWIDGGASYTNATYAAGDALEIMVVSTAGTVTQISIQVEFERT